MVICAGALPSTDLPVTSALDLLLVSCLAVLVFVSREFPTAGRRSRRGGSLWWASVLLVAGLYALSPLRPWSALAIVILVGAWTGVLLRRRGGVPPDAATSLWPLRRPEGVDPERWRTVQIGWAAALGLICIRLFARGGD